jgi:hypothetical protein
MHTKYLITMAPNRIHYFIKNILQNSSLNREKFVNNKKKYNIIKAKNNNPNMIIKRKFSSYSKQSSDCGGPKIPPSGPELVTTLFMVIGTYIASYNFDFKEK